MLENKEWEIGTFPRLSLFVNLYLRSLISNTDFLELLELHLLRNSGEAIQTLVMSKIYSPNFLKRTEILDEALKLVDKKAIRPIDMAILWAIVKSAPDRDFSEYLEYHLNSRGLFLRDENLLSPDLLKSALGNYYGSSELALPNPGELSFTPVVTTVLGIFNVSLQV